MTVTFLGHRQVPASLRAKLMKTVTELILYEGADDFHVGNQGEFDAIVLSVLRELALSYPHIRYTVVLAYMPTHKEKIEDMPTVYPEGLEAVPR